MDIGGGGGSREPGLIYTHTRIYVRYAHTCEFVYTVHVHVYDNILSLAGGETWMSLLGLPHRLELLRTGTEEPL